ncbi:alpha/beta hydrolase [Actinomycetospora endophytica]|uniref:Alpha/beta hydrolase n=2 Tax=Actinomycetospora endophytica TaxID=2291215 RepID=A0ABS8PDI0_9PSEU|nr:alpha/beta hydrolase [Actinomycetospora endophytica]
MNADDDELGPEREVALRDGTIRYHDAGSGPVVVFVHGALVDATLWARVVPVLVDAGLRCITPTWPLGAHRVPVPHMDLSPPGVAAVIDEFLGTLDLHDVTVVGNDTGGGLVQILLATTPRERVGRVVLTPSDSFEAFFPPRFAFLPLLAHIPGALASFAKPAARFPAINRLPVGFSALAKHPLGDDRLRRWMTPTATDRRIRADAGRFLRGVDRRHTLAAADRFGEVDLPVLLAWAVEDRVFPISLAHRIAARLPNARIAPVEDSFCFVPQDRPDRLAELIREFVRDEPAARRDPSRATQPGPAS